MYTLEIHMVWIIMYCRTAKPRCCDNVSLAGNELYTLLHRVNICNQEMVFLPFFFGYTPTQCRKWTASFEGSLT